MRDYARILGKITESVWLITPTALAQIVDIVDKRIANGKLSDDELQAQLSDIGIRENGDGGPIANNGIGILSLYGPIFGKANLMTQMSGATSLETFRSDLDEMLQNDRVHSIILDIDSPGGTSDGVAETGELIRAGREQKPIYAIADSQMGSAAYWLGSQATEVFATPSGSVGSVGAYTVHEDRSVSDAQQGVKYTFISAGEYKTEGNPHETLSAEGAAYRQEVIDEVYDDFVNAIASGRGVDHSTVVANFGGGRMLTAKKALEAGIIDGITTQDALINHLSKPTGFIQVPMAAMKVMGENGPEVLTSENVNFKARLMIDGKDIAEVVKKQLEHKEMEHSEPGTGVPPAPRDTDTGPGGSNDPAIEGGWRRDVPPPANPEAEVNNNKGGERMDEAQLNKLMEMYGVEDTDALLEAIESEHTEASALSSVVTANAEQVALAEQYPQMWAKLTKLENADMEHKANAFVSSVERIMQPDGDGFKPTAYALSALSQDTVREAHMKFAKGEGTLADFEDAIKLLVNGGIVELGETGTNREGEVPLDSQSDAGIDYVRKQFGAKVAEVQAELKCDYATALRETSNKYPDLVAAYKSAIPR